MAHSISADTPNSYLPTSRDASPRRHARGRGRRSARNRGAQNLNGGDFQCDCAPTKFGPSSCFGAVLKHFPGHIQCPAQVVGEPTRVVEFAAESTGGLPGG